MEEDSDAEIVNPDYSREHQNGGVQYSPDERGLPDRPFPPQNGTHHYQGPPSNYDQAMGNGSNPYQQSPYQSPSQLLEAPGVQRPTVSTTDINSEISPTLDFLLDQIDGREPTPEAHKQMSAIFKKLDSSNREKLSIIRKACKVSQAIKTVQAAFEPMEGETGLPKQSDMVLLPRQWVEEVLHLLQQQSGTVSVDGGGEPSNGEERAGSS